MFRSVLLLAVGAVLGALLVAGLDRPVRAQNEGAAAPAAPTMEDVARLKTLVPPSSHPMADASYNVVALWFAAKKKNWPLANYYLGETRNRVRWEVRLNPSPKGPSGPVDMKAMQESIESGGFATVKQAIDKKDSAAFTAGYKQLLENCYSCHMAAGRTYLRPMIPVTPGQPIINPDPTATWP